MHIIRVLVRKTGVVYLTMLCCYVYYTGDSKKQNNGDTQHIQTYASFNSLQAFYDRKGEICKN